MNLKSWKNGNGYNVNPVPKSIIEKCVNIVKDILFLPQIFPTCRETIQLEYELLNGKYLEFELFEESISVLYIDENEIEHEYEMEYNIDKINELVLKFYR